MSDTTISWDQDSALPPAVGATAPAAVTAFVLLWCKGALDRVGEIASVPGGFPGVEVLFGRSPASPRDAIARAEWARHRPGQVEPTGPLPIPQMSRDQLRVSGLADGGLRVENIGRCPLMKDGREITSARVFPGDILEFPGLAMMLCASRPAALRSFGYAAPPWPDFPFGLADPFGIVGESPEAWALRERISFIAARNAHVLILGSSGTGKELVAQALHARSDRGGRPLVSRNAATIPEGLVDAELFGNLRNYPNPGMPERPGLIGRADGSSLFLDEFGELPSALQAHLLRVLDAGEYQRLGEASTRKADFRLLAATNRAASELKEDVLARLRMRIELPDLNDRRADIPLLIRHLLVRMTASDDTLARCCFPGGDRRAPPRITPALLRALVTRSYTTHVRELETLLWTAIGEAGGKDLDVWPDMDEPDAPPPSRGGGEESERERAEKGQFTDPESLSPEELQAALDRHGGRQELTWRALNLSSRHVLARLIKRYGLHIRRGPHDPGE